jgi:cytidylate kinase
MGAGVEEIGKLVAQLMGGEYVDREIIAGVAGRVQRSPAEVALKEEPPATLMGRILHALGQAQITTADNGGAFRPAWEMPLEDTRYLDAMTAVIRDLAKGPSIVVRGRGSQFILKGQPATLHVFVVAPVGLRAKRVMQDLRLDEAAAKKEIDRVDGSRRAFVKKYFNAELGDPAHYDLVVSTERLTYEAAAQLIRQALDLATGAARHPPGG